MALETRFPTVRDTQPALLAYHCTEAGLTKQAIGYWQKAGKRAIERSANLEASSSRRGAGWSVASRYTTPNSTTRRSSSTAGLTPAWPS